MFTGSPGRCHYHSVCCKLSCCRDQADAITGIFDPVDVFAAELNQRVISQCLTEVGRGHPASRRKQQPGPGQIIAAQLCRNSR